MVRAALPFEEMIGIHDYQSDASSPEQPPVKKGVLAGATASRASTEMKPSSDLEDSVIAASMDESLINKKLDDLEVRRQALRHRKLLERKAVIELEQHRLQVEATTVENEIEESELSSLESQAKADSPPKGTTTEKVVPIKIFNGHIYI